MLISIINRMAMKVLTRAGGLVLLLFLVTVFIVGFVTMRTFEASDSALQTLDGYAWYFAATITTTGYGDITPQSGVGRLYGVFTMFVGLVTLTVIAGSTVIVVRNFLRRRMEGKIQLHEKGHIVIFGNRGEETKALLTELQGDREVSRQRIVLCSMQTKENPFPGDVEFVNGDLTSEDVLIRSCTARANKIIIHADTDERTTLIALGVREVNKHAQVVAKLDFEKNVINLRRIGEHKIQCITPVNVRMIVREITNPGITKAIESLLGSSGQDLNCIEIPDDFRGTSFETILCEFKRDYKALVYAAIPKGVEDYEPYINPELNFRVTAGMVLLYIGADTLTNVDWKSI
jgi:voltage-gated potassium channel